MSATVQANPHRLEPDLEVIQYLIDQLIASLPNEEVTANLYSARLHVTRAIKEVCNTEVAA